MRRKALILHNKKGVPNGTPIFLLLLKFSDVKKRQFFYVTFKNKEPPNLVRIVSDKPAFYSVEWDKYKGS